MTRQMNTLDLLVKHLPKWPSYAESIHQRKDGILYYIVNGIAVAMVDKQLRNLPVADDAGEMISRTEFEQYTNKNHPQRVKDSFQEAAIPLVNWLSKNNNADQYVLVTDTYAELFTRQISLATSEYKKA